MACNHLITIKNPQTGEHIQVPCGHCINCLVDMQTEWATRMMIEYRSNLSRPAVFVTLTYNDENLPTEEYNKEGVVYEKASVVKHHIQQFMRSLRTKINRLKNRGKWKGWQGSIKYFFTSEYGPTGGRPHYHGIIYGLTKSDLHLIEDIWSKGFCYVGDVNEKTITYCAKYCTKPIEETMYPDRKGYFDNERWMDEQGIRRKPFRLMSTGIGKQYCEDEKNLRFHFNDIFKNNYIRVGKMKKKIPRYLKEKIYTEENFKKYCPKRSDRYNKYIKLKNNTIKNDKKYGSPNITYNLINLIGRAQYYRHLFNSIQNYKISEINIDRDIQNAKQRESILIQNRRKWMQRAGRNHIQ